MESEEAVWIGSGTILTLELKGCNLEMTCPQHEPSVLASLRVSFWDLFFLFVLYINDLPQCLEHCSINMYGDDTVMYFTNPCTSETDRVVQDDLQQQFISTTVDN